MDYWAISRIASLSLVELSPIGSWSKHKRTVTTAVDRVHVVDLKSLDHKDLHPPETMDVDAEGIVLGDEDEGELVIPSRGVYDSKSSPGGDVTEKLPGINPEQEIQDKVYAGDLYDNEDPEVVIPEGIPSPSNSASSPGALSIPCLRAILSRKYKMSSMTQWFTHELLQQCRMYRVFPHD